MSILIFFVVLFVLILVHEWGHFIVAKKTGMRVDEFGIGFPPKMFGIKKGETEYTFNWLPIGGFVRIWGENGEEDTSELTAEEKAQAFGARPKWAQALVLIAGVTMNVLFAWLLFSITFMAGVPTAVEESVASDDAQLIVAGVLPDSPAEAVPAGAFVESLKTAEETLSPLLPSAFSEFIQANPTEEISLTYNLGDGETETISFVPQTGLVPDDPEKAIAGISLALVETQSLPFFTAVADGFTTTVFGLKQISLGLWSLVAGSVTGEADLSQVAGPVGIVGMVGDAASYGWTSLLMFTAMISLNLAIINMLPVPALDGGRLVFVAIEAITGKTIPPTWAGRVNLVGFALLMILMVVVTYNDVLRLI